jgi:hypothetical protein
VCNVVLELEKLRVLLSRKQFYMGRGGGGRGGLYPPTLRTAINSSSFSIP